MPTFSVSVGSTLVWAMLCLTCAQAAFAEEPTAGLCVVVDEACHVAGSKVNVRLELQQSSVAITGGEISLQFDADVLDLIDIQPGSACAPMSPFGVEVSQVVDEAVGRITYGVSVPLGGAGTVGPSTMACC